MRGAGRALASRRPGVTRRAWPLALCALAAALFAATLFGRLGHPLLWNDEGETAMYGARVLAYGYPKVHGERNVVYEFGADLASGVKERDDAYIGATWGQFYLAAPAVWWARRAGDPWARTWRLRAPFALAGALGVALLAWAVLPVFRGRPRDAALFAAAYLALAALSVSLVLHLREMRYYGPFVALSAALLGVHLRYAVFGTLGRTGYALWGCALLWLLFETFYAAFFAFAVLGVLERLDAARRAPAGAPRREALWGLAPIALASLAVAPLLVYHETFATAGSFASDLGLSPRTFAANLGHLAAHLLRHELLGPALVARAARLALVRERDANRRTADRLSLFAVGYALVLCLDPLVYERYFVVLSPVVALVFLLDAAALLQRAGRRALAAAALAALVAVSLAASRDDLAGRLAELATPVRGPLDFVVPYLAARYPHPEALVIATNYEATPLMVYLGSRVIVGTHGLDVPREGGPPPDVVFPRRWWRPGLRELSRLLARGRFERHTFPIPDLPYNGNPSLSPSTRIPELHRFRTARLREGQRSLELYERARPGRFSGGTSTQWVPR